MANLTFDEGAKLGNQETSIGEHGSWNRIPLSGYKVVFVPFKDGKPAGSPIDVLTGFVSAEEKALGRPVGVSIARDGSLLVADDVGNTIWRVAQAARKQARADDFLPASIRARLQRCRPLKAKCT